MGDTYVEVGTITKGLKIKDDDMKAAGPAAKAAIEGWIKNTAGVTSTKPKDGAGVKLGITISEIVSGTNTLTCKIVGDVFELPKGGRKTMTGRPIGQGKIVGAKADVASCATAAVADLMTNIGSGVKAAPLSAADAKLTYIAPHAITFKAGAPQAVVADATPKITAALDALVKADPRFVQDAATAGDAFKDGMTAYVLKVTIGVTVDTTAKTAEITFSCAASTYPTSNLVSATSIGTAKLSGDIRDKTIVAQIVDYAKDKGAQALKAIPTK